jgi:DNA-binding transcriptional LysR family regulator
LVSLDNRQSGCRPVLHVSKSAIVEGKRMSSAHRAFSHYSERDLAAEVTPTEIEHRTLVLDGRSQMDRMIREWLRVGGVEPRPAMELGQPEALRNTVTAGLAVSILPPEVVAPKPPPGVLVRPLRPALVRETTIIQRRDKPDEPALRIVRETILHMLRQSTPPAAARMDRTGSHRRR